MTKKNIYDDNASFENTFFYKNKLEKRAFYESLSRRVNRAVFPLVLRCKVSCTKTRDVTHARLSQITDFVTINFDEKKSSKTE